LIQRLIRLLTTPVFAYLPSHRESRLPLPDPNLCTKILAWTAPFATLALKRLLQLWASGKPIDVEEDSIGVEESDESIMEFPVEPISLEGIENFDKTQDPDSAEKDITDGSEEEEKDEDEDEDEDEDSRMTQDDECEQRQNAQEKDEDGGSRTGKKDETKHANGEEPEVEKDGDGSESGKTTGMKTVEFKTVELENLDDNMDLGAFSMSAINSQDLESD
jgi:hypothetical protein